LTEAIRFNNGITFHMTSGNGGRDSEDRMICSRFIWGFDADINPRLFIDHTGVKNNPSPFYLSKFFPNYLNLFSASGCCRMKILDGLNTLPD
jgi:hypothetical protein